MNRVKIVIGSNYDLEFLNEAINDNNLIVYAFEPNLYIFESCIKNKNIPKNYKLIQKAVSDKVGKSEFNISSDTLSLLSSLKKFKTANNSIFNETIFVDTITMEEFIEQENIKNIEYLHIDSQGSDYDILKSFGNKIKIVEAGVCESMAPNLNWSLYENQHTFEDFKNFFLSNGFDISYKPNSKGMIGSYEVNIYFKKSLTKPRLIKKVI